jgi:hypothetical protein
MDYPVIELGHLQKEVNSYLLEQRSETGSNYFHIPHNSIQNHVVSLFKHCNLCKGSSSAM